MNEHTVDPNAIRRRAYERWQQRGCPAGSADSDWLDAESELAKAGMTIEAGAIRPRPLTVTLATAASSGVIVQPRVRSRRRSVVTQAAATPAARVLVALANGRR